MLTRKRAHACAIALPPGAGHGRRTAPVGDIYYDQPRDAPDIRSLLSPRRTHGCVRYLGALVACPTEEDESESSDASLSALTLTDAPSDTATVTYTLSGAIGDEYTTASAIGGAGVSGTLSATASSTFDIANPDTNTEATITLEPMSDADISDETITLTIASITFADSGTATDIAGSDITGTGVTNGALSLTIVDDDDPSAALTKTDGTEADANPTNAVFTLTLTNAPSDTATVTYTLSGAIGDEYTTASAIGGAGVSGTLSATANSTFDIANPDTNTEATITLVPMSEADGSDETITLTIASITFADSGTATDIAGSDITGTGVTNGALSLTIVDDEAGPTEVTTFAITGGTSPIIEDRASTTDDITLTVTLDAVVATTSGLDIPYTIVGPGITFTDITIGGANLADANGLSGTINIAMGASANTLVIAGRGDDADEGDETMLITLGALPNNDDGATLTAASGVDDGVRIVITDGEIATGSPSTTGGTGTTPVIPDITASTAKTFQTTEFTYTISDSSANFFVEDDADAFLVVIPGANLLGDAGDGPGGAGNEDVVVTITARDVDDARHARSGIATDGTTFSLIATTFVFETANNGEVQNQQSPNHLASTNVGGSVIYRVTGP